jgi:uncharacterized protein YecT (DUF1311 family)
MKRWALVTAPVVAIAVAGLVSLGGAGPPAVGIGAVGVMAGSTSVPVVTYSRSCEKTAQTQVALDELKEVQRQLAAVLRREAKGTSHSLIVAAETGFAGYEKAECTLRAYVNRGGSIYPMIFTECETALTVQRIQSVLEYLSELPA